jgi:hypothetical protein
MSVHAAMSFSIARGSASRKVCIEAPAALMWAPLILVNQPSIEIRLQLVDCAVDLLAEGHSVERRPVFALP